MIFHKKLVLGLLLSNRTWATDSTSLTCDAIKFIFHSFSKIRVIYDKNSSHLFSVNAALLYQNSTLCVSQKLQGDRNESFRAGKEKHPSISVGN